MREDYGVGAALRAAFEMFTVTSRSTGRTEHLIDNLQEGDIVICSTAGAAGDIERRAKERGIAVRATVCKPDTRSVAQTLVGRHERVCFDHGWVEQYFLRCIDEARRELGGLQDHLQTRRPTTRASYHHHFERFSL